MFSICRSTAAASGQSIVKGLFCLLATAHLAGAGAQPSSHMPYTEPGLGSGDTANTVCTTEPDVLKALGWWIPQRGVWTPIGWKDHLFRFTMPYNGTLLCAPFGVLPKEHIKQYQGKDFQLTFHPSADGSIPELPKVNTRLHRIDGGLGIQNWREDHEAPVLVNTWRREEGVVLKTETFAHMQGGGDVTTATEPLYAWVRMSMDHVDKERHPETFSFAIQLSKIWYLQRGAATLDEIAYLEAMPDLIPLDEPLTSSTVEASGDGRNGLIVRQGNNVRLQVMPGGQGTALLSEHMEGGESYILQVELPATEGAYVDMLVPMLSEPPDVFAQEAALGYDGALAQADAYWSEKPATAATIHTPEDYINNAIRRNIQFAQVVAELNPENGVYSFLSGSYGYDALWSTPTSMISHMFLDLLGYHDVVEKHIELYHESQGSVKPPGPSYELHPGYLSTPKTLTALDWLGDHGAILEILSRHALLTGDQAFIDHWLEPIIKGCDFIKEAVSDTDHDGVKGVMPPAVATDTLVPVQGVWTQAWCFKGLQTSVELLEKIGNPRAAEFASVAADFKKAFNESFMARTAKQPVWEDDEGAEHPVLPAFLIPPPERHIYDDAFLLDIGPLVLPWSGLMDAHNPLMVSFADYFREGPPTELWGPRSSSIARAILMHEISSCEPCYSWNIVNSWQTGDRAKFLEGMYALFTGGISPQTFINCEHRNNMYGTVFVAPLMTWCMRQAVVDDQLEAEKLHLLRMCPLAWISKDEDTVFENMPTAYGPVDLRWRLSEDGKNLDVKYAAQWREKPGQVVLHFPPVDGLETVFVNGQATPVSQGELVLE